jgi:protein phosphatase
VTLTLEGAARTDVGLARNENEDTFGFFPELSFYAVADGMGGHAAGATASTMTIATMRQALVDLEDDDLTPVVDARGYCSVGGRLLMIALYQANEHVLEAARAHPEMQGMGTTVAALLFDRRYDVAAICHVGDSRVYRIRGDAIEQLTEDHTFVRRLLKEGRIDPADVPTSPHRHVLTQAVGVESLVRPDLRLERPLAGDVFVLCSDGVHDAMRDDEMLGIVQAAASPQLACERLIDLANERGGRDNSTVLIVRCRAADPEDPTLGT